MTSPKASVILLTYNQEQFVEEAFLSLLNQDMDDLEIVVSDDCSGDATWGKILALADSYRGQKKIILSRNPENIGIVSNYSAAVKQSTGELIFTAAGDDISLPDRCSKSIQFLLDHEKKYDLVAADGFDMAFDGTILGPKKNDNLEAWTIEKWFERRPFFFGASHMMTRKLVELAPLDGRLPNEDQCLVFRAILTDGAIRLPENLVCHRRGGLSQQSVRLQFGHRRAQMILDSARGIVEFEQFLRDVKVMGRKSLVEGLISKKIAYLRSVQNLFRYNLSPKAFIAFWTDAPIPFREKIRYSRYYLFYPLLSIVHGIRDTVRVLINRQQPN